MFHVFNFPTSCIRILLIRHNENRWFQQRLFSSTHSVSVPEFRNITHKHPCTTWTNPCSATIFRTVLKRLGCNLTHIHTHSHSFIRVHTCTQKQQDSGGNFTNNKAIWNYKYFPVLETERRCRRETLRNLIVCIRKYDVTSSHLACLAHWLYNICINVPGYVLWSRSLQGSLHRLLPIHDTNNWTVPFISGCCVHEILMRVVWGKWYVRECCFFLGTEEWVYVETFIFSRFLNSNCYVLKRFRGQLHNKE